MAGRSGAAQPKMAAGSPTGRLTQAFNVNQWFA